MQRLTNRLADVLRRVAQWLRPQFEQWDPEILAQLPALVAKAEQFAAGTSGEFKRNWVMHRLKKLFPKTAATVLALHLEYLLIQQGARK